MGAQVIFGSLETSSSLRGELAATAWATCFYDLQTLIIPPAAKSAKKIIGGNKLWLQNFLLAFCVIKKLGSRGLSTRADHHAIIVQGRELAQ